MDDIYAIPIWRKTSLSPEEAAVLGNVAERVIRYYVALAKMGKSDFPVFFVGNSAKIHRVRFEIWLEEQAMRHVTLETKRVKDAIAEATRPKKAGRPRKARAAI